jgi:PAS domain S-box-containing protein
MTSELRKTGISIVGDVPWGTHFCNFYETKQDLLDTLVPFFKAGLECKEYCLWVVSNSHLITVEEAKGALAQAVPDFDRHLSDENIEILNGPDWYLQENVFNLERVTNAWAAKLKRALALGYDGMRVSGDTFWLREKDWKDFCAYEKQLNDSITDRPMTVLCTYPLAKSGAAEILDVAQTHQFAIARRQGEWKVIESLELIQAKGEIKRLNEALRRVNKGTPRQPGILRYGAAVLSVTTALIITLWMRMELGQQSTPIVGLFLCAVMFSAWFGGVGPGVLAIALALPAFDYFFVTPIYSLAVEIKEVPRLIVFVLSALFVALLSAAQRSAAETLGRARDVLDGTVQDLKRTNESLHAKNAERQVAEQALRESEEQFRQLAENIREVFWMSTPDFGAAHFTMLYISPAYESVWGRTRESLYQDPRSFIAAIHPEDRARVVDVIERVREQGFEVEFRVVRPDGSISWIWARGFPILDESGRFYRIAGLAEDITERKRAEEKLKQSESQFAEAQRLAHVGSWDWDLRSNTVTWSDELYRIFGLQPGEIDPAHQAMSFIQPEDRDLVLSTVKSSLKNREPYSIYYRVLRPDGDERILHSRGHIVSDEDGDPIRVFGATQDLTELKQTEEKLKLSESLLAEAQQMTHVGSWNWSIKDNNLTWSDELYRILGLDRREFRPTREANLERVHPEDRDLVSVSLDTSLRTLEPFSQSVRIFRPDGEMRTLQIHCTVVSDEHGKPVRMFGTCQDVTDLRLAEEQLKLTSKQLRALSASLQAAREEEGTRIAREIHDELGAALSSLRWDLEDLDETISESRNGSQLQELRKKIEAMMRLTDTTLNTVRRIASELRPVALDALGLNEAIEWQARQFQERTGIIVHCDCILENVDLSREQSTAAFRIFQEALTNILRHAQATRVNIQMKEKDGEFILTISDNGRGITDDEKSGQRTLGLLGMRERAHLIRGKIDIGRSDGKGTLVTVRIPISG